MKLRPYQAPRRQPNINDMIYPKGSRQPGNVWVGGVVMNVPEPSGGPAVSPTPTPSVTPTMTVTPTSSLTPTPSITPTNTVTPSITPTNTVTPTRTLTPTPTPSSSPLPSGTTEANAYLTAVVLSGGTIDSTISAATRTLFTSLVSNGLYNKIYAFYTHLGGVSASHGINGKSPNNNAIAWNGGWSFSNTGGSTPNGTNAWGDLVGCSPSVFGTLNSTSAGYYSLTDNLSGNRVDMGLFDAGSELRYRVAGYLNSSNAPNFSVNSTGLNASSTNTRSDGFYVASRIDSSTQTIYKNGSYLLSGATASVSPQLTSAIPIGAELTIGQFYAGYSNRAQGFSFVGSGLTASEVSTLSTIVNTWATAIGRNVY